MRRQLSAWVLGVAVGLAVLVLPSSATAQPAGAELAKRLTAEMRADLGGVLRDARQQLVELARLPPIRAQDAEACNADLADRVVPSRYTAFAAANRAGDLYCVSPPRPASPISVSDRAYFLRAIGNRGLGVGGYQIGRATGLESVGIGFPVRAGERITGVVTSPIDIAWLDDRVRARQPRRAVDVLVIDAQGTVLARAGRVATPAGRNLGRWAIVQAMLRERHGVGRFKLAGRPVTAAFRWVSRSRGSMRVAVSVRR